MALTLRQWRRAKEFSQEKMADALGVCIATYQNWENEPEKVSISNAQKIAELFNVPLDEIAFKKGET